MAASTTTKAYPRATVRRMIKAHSNCNISKNADVMVFLDYVLFVEALVREAGIQARIKGDKVISARDIRKAQRDTLRKFRV